MSALSALKANPAIAAKLAINTPEAKAPEEKAHTIQPDIVVAEGRVFISFPVEELAKARPSKVKIGDDGKERGGKNLVFGLTRAEFEVEGVRFYIGSGYHTWGPCK